MIRPLLFLFALFAPLIAAHSEPARKPNVDGSTIPDRLLAQARERSLKTSSMCRQDSRHSPHQSRTLPAMIFRLKRMSLNSSLSHRFLATDPRPILPLKGYHGIDMSHECSISHHPLEGRAPSRSAPHVGDDQKSPIQKTDHHLYQTHPPPPNHHLDPNIF